MEIICNTTPKRRAKITITSYEKPLSFTKSPYHQQKTLIKKALINLKKNSTISKQPEFQLERTNSLEHSMKKSIEKLIKNEDQCFEIFEEFINQKDNWPQFRTPKKIFYLIEDIAIMFFVAKSEIKYPGTKFWTLLISNGIFNKSVESLNTRYFEYLSLLTQSDLMQISTYLLDYGVNGFLVFCKDAYGDNQLDCINPIDEEAFEKIQKKKIKSSLVKSSQKQTIRKQESKELTLGKRKLFQDSEFNFASERKRTESCLCKVKELEKNFVDNEKILNKRASKQRHHHAELENDMRMQTDFFGSRSVSHSNNFEFDDIDKKLGWFEKHFQLNREEVLDQLTKVSGNWQDLLSTLKGRNLEVIWESEDDFILRNSKSFYNENFQILLKKKGEKCVVDRIKFLKIYKNIM